MPTDPTLPPYPPPRSWSFPPPPVGRRWFWLALTGLVASTLVAVTLVVTAVVLESVDAPGLIESPSVLATIDDECAQMTDRVEQPGPAVSGADLATAIRDQNTWVTAMVDKIASLPQRQLTEDRPTLSWLNDWRRLVAAREAYAATLAEGGPASTTFQIPRAQDGNPIARRMDDALLEPVCTVPDVLLDPLQRNTSTI